MLNMFYQSANDATKIRDGQTDHYRVPKGTQ